MKRLSFVLALISIAIALVHAGDATRSWAQAKQKPRARLAKQVAPEPSEPMAGADASTPETAQVLFHRFAVAAGDTHAARAGLEVLRRGGNAADAAAAAVLALGVTSPGSSGLGGGGFALYYDARLKRFTFLDFREQAPQATTPDMFVKVAKERPKASETGALAVGVPGEPAGIDELLKRFGSIERGQIAAPAIQLAEKGFKPSEYLATLLNLYGKELSRDPAFASWFAPHGSVSPTETVSNPRLAKTLRQFAQYGSEPFYRGAIAQDLVTSIRNMGGILTAHDLQSYKVVEREPLRERHVGYTWVTAPAPSAGGYALLTSLNMLEKWLPMNGRESAAELSHALAESWKGPYMDRMYYFGDPDHIALPLDALRHPVRVGKRIRVFDPRRAQDASAYRLPLPGTPSHATPANDAGTSHVCVVDAKGNVASITTSVNLPFGAQFTVQGMVMNDQMDDFAKAVGKANAFGLPGGANNLPGPGRRPVSTMTPTVVLDADGPRLCIGGVGGSRIATAVEQVALYTLVYNNSVRDTVSRPRIHHQGLPTALEHEPYNANVLAQLKKRGHALKPMMWNAKVQAIRIDPPAQRESDTDSAHVLHAYSDPRNGAVAAGE
jgi:gamma-glutamyltranspeptidase/glutathione hydrolase